MYFPNTTANSVGMASSDEHPILTFTKVLSDMSSVLRWVSRRCPKSLVVAINDSLVHACHGIPSILIQTSKGNLWMGRPSSPIHLLTWKDDLPSLHCQCYLKRT